MNDSPSSDFSSVNLGENNSDNILSNFDFFLDKDNLFTYNCV